MFLTLWIARLPLSHRPTVLRSQLNGSEAPMWKGFTCSGMCCAPPEPKEFRRLRSRRATPFPPNLAFPNPNLDSRLLVEQSQPVVRRFVLQAVHSKTRLDTTRSIPNWAQTNGFFFPVLRTLTVALGSAHYRQAPLGPHVPGQLPLWRLGPS